MKYKSELLSELIEKNGHTTTKVPHYESECENEFISEVRGAYPKLIDYSGEWLNYVNSHVNIGKFPTERVENVTNARFENVVPYGYKTAILKGSTKYHDIDTGEILETFEEGRNLELVSVKMPVLTTIGKNLFNGVLFDGRPTDITPNMNYKNTGFIEVKSNESYAIQSDGNMDGVYFFNENKEIISKASTPYTTTKVITPEKCKYISVQLFQRNEPKIQIEEGTQATSYEPFKSNILSVNEPIELRGIGDVQDTLDCLTGELTERIGEDGEVLAKEVIKTVELSCLDENNTPTKFKPYEGVMYVQTSSETLPPLLDMEVPVEAINQNLASFIK